MALPESTVRSLTGFARRKYRAIRHLATLVRWFRNWPQVWQATRGRALLPPLQLRCGLTVFHGEGDDPLFLFREIFLERCYGRDDFYQPHPAHMVLDLGANIGMFALYLQSRAPGILVHCFEPAAETGSRLAKNISANNLDGYVSVYPFAVSNHNGTARLNRTAMSGHRTLLSGQFIDSDHQEAVACLTLHEAVRMCGPRRIDFLKIDVEGAEIDILEGADPGVWDRIDRVAMEYHARFHPQCRERCVRALRAGGFREFRFRSLPPDHQLGTIHASR